MKTYIEWSGGLYHTGVFIQKENIYSGMGGFRSVYMFSEDDINVIKNQENCKGYGRLMKHSDELLLDFDGNLQDALSFKEYCNNQGIAYEMYCSGGGEDRMHFHIPLDSLYSHILLPEVQKMYITEYLKVKCDLSVFRSNSLIRLPAQVHHKTGKRKRLLTRKASSRFLTLPIDNILQDIKQIEVIPNDFSCEDVESSAIIAFSQLTSLFLQSPSCRGKSRTVTIWSAIEPLVKLGLSGKCIQELIMKSMETWENPKEKEIIVKIIKQELHKYRKGSNINDI